MTHNIHFQITTSKGPEVKQDFRNVSPQVCRANHRTSVEEDSRVDCAVGAGGTTTNQLMQSQPENRPWREFTLRCVLRVR